MRSQFSFVTTLCGLASCLAVSIASAQGPIAPSGLLHSPGPNADVPELKVLDRQTGEWTTTMQQKGVDSVVTVMADVRWVLGGNFLRSQYEGDGVQGILLTTYDKEAKCYRRWQFDENGKMTVFKGQWDADAESMHFEHTSRDGNYRIVMENKIGENGASETFRIVVRDRDGQELNEYSGSSTRLKKTARN